MSADGKLRRCQATPTTKTPITAITAAVQKDARTSQRTANGCEREPPEITARLGDSPAALG